MTTHTHTEVVHLRVPTETVGRLREHAQDIGRSLASESRLWLEAGAALSFYAAAVNPRAALSVPDPVELDQLRQRALTDLHKAIARALPHQVVPAGVIDAFTPEMSVN
jgi:hypothetical protein